jgi:hypothetical protein
MAVFVNKFGIKKYLRCNKISDVLCSIARAFHPDLSKDEFKHFFAYSGRVWVLVLLDEAGMTPAFTTSCLR